MSPVFIKQFQAANKCKACKQYAHKGRKLCMKHLEKARFEWHNWSMERRAKRLCCYCDRKSYRGFLRCRKHTKYNRAMCSAWMATHGHEIWEKRKAETLKTGICQHCRFRNPVIPGTLRCDRCRMRAKLQKLTR